MELHDELAHCFMALHDTKLVNCLALGTHRHHRSSERSGIVALLNLSQGIVIEHVTISNQSHSPVLYLILLAFFSSLLNCWRTFIQTLSWWSFPEDSVSSPRCTQQVASQSLVPPESFVFLVADSSTVSAAIFAFSTRPSLLCSEPFQLFSSLVRNSLHKSRSLNAIQRRQPDSNRGLEQSTLVLVPLIVVDLATNVTLVLSNVNLSCPSWLFSWLRNLCHHLLHWLEHRLLGHQLDRLGVLVPRAGDCNKTDTVTIILMYSSQSSSHPWMRSWRSAIRHSWTLVLELEVWHGFQRQPASSSLSSASIVRHSARRHLGYCFDQWCCCSSWSMLRWSTWFATISSSLTGTGLPRKTVHTLQQRFSCSTPPRSDIWTVLKSPKSCFLGSDEETVPTFTSSTAHWPSNCNWSTLVNLTSKLSCSISDISSKTLTDEVHKHLMDLTQHCMAGLHPPALSSHSFTRHCNNTAQIALGTLVDRHVPPQVHSRRQLSMTCVGPEDVTIHSMILSRLTFSSWRDPLLLDVQNLPSNQWDSSAPSGSFVFVVVSHRNVHHSNQDLNLWDCHCLCIALSVWEHFIPPHLESPRSSQLYCVCSPVALVLFPAVGYALLPAVGCALTFFGSGVPSLAVFFRLSPSMPALPVRDIGAAVPAGTAHVVRPCFQGLPGHWVCTSSDPDLPLRSPG